MESMRMLNTSLPRPTPRKHRRNRRQDAVLQAFKNAALSVTNLYRTAEADTVRARLAGYQDAVEELLKFMDSEDIGLDDGEGWRIRQWATGRIEPRAEVLTSSDSEDDKIDEIGLRGSSSPVHVNTSPPPSDSRQQTMCASENQSPIVHHLPQPQADCRDESIAQSTKTPAMEQFTFRSSRVLPLESKDMEMQNHHTSNKRSMPASEGQSTAPAITLNIKPRTSRSTRPGRPFLRAGSASRNLGSGAGTKRRLPFGDYFDDEALDVEIVTKRGR